MIKKIGYILDKKQKRNLVWLTIVIFIGSFVELLGVAMINPVISIIESPDIIESDEVYRNIGQIFHLHGVNQYIFFLAASLIAVYIFKNVYICLEYYFQYRYVYNSQRNLSVRMFTDYLSEDYLFHVSKNKSELQRNILKDVEGFYIAVLSAIQSFTEILVCVVLTIYLLLSDPLFTLVVIGIVAGFFLLFLVIFRKYTIRLGQRLRESLAVQNKWILQGFEGIKEIKVLNKEDFFSKKYDFSYKDFTNARIKQSFIYSIPKPIIETICIVGLLVVIIARISMGVDPKEFVSTLAVFVVAVFRMLPSFSRISGYMGNIMVNRASVEAVYTDLKEIEGFKAEENKKLTGDKKFFGDILIDNVNFCYPGNPENVFEDISLSIQQNKSVAIIGASGAGKSTLADIILGVLKPQKGSITVDGKDIYEFIDSWHKAVGYIPQQIYLMDDSIRNNVAFGEEGNMIDDNKVWKALKEVELEDFVQGLPEGLDTQIGDRGVKLSGGQRQRLGIARTLYFNPQIIVFDEATSALDNDTERAVMESIEALHGSRTMLIIAHRLTTIKGCDQIFEVSNKKVIEKSKEWLREELERTMK